MTGFVEASAYLESLGVDAMKKLGPSTHRIEVLCELLNHPEREVPAIHITGTNGKTSTARIASSLLTGTELKVGTYTSPHLQTIRERIALGGEPISENEFGDLFDHLWPYVELAESKLDERLSYFEVLTGMFFLWAAESVDVAVVEVGMGGRWDATNVLPSSVAVVTNVSLDHTAMLGTDRATIAREKAGIVKGGVVVTAERSGEIIAIVKDAADGAGARLSKLGGDFDVLDNRVALGGRYLSVQTSTDSYEGLFLPLHGAHQGVNAATALEAVTGLLPARPLSHEIVVQGMAQVTAPGRLEPVRTDATGVPVILDVAHNPDGMSALMSSLLEAFAFERVIFVFGVLADKDYKGMLAEMARVPCTVVIAKPASGRAVSVDGIAAAAAEIGLESSSFGRVADAMESAMVAAREGDLVCVTGSHYVVGEARDVLLPSAAPAAR